jgi:hypothetical protein
MLPALALLLASLCLLAGADYNPYDGIHRLKRQDFRVHHPHKEDEPQKLKVFIGVPTGHLKVGTVYFAARGRG